MKIIISNYRYFMSGGPERYLFAVEKLLKDNGHTVFPFSVRSSKNIQNEYENFFLSPIGDGSAVYAHEYKHTPIVLAKAVSRMFYSIEGYYKAKRFSSLVSPDIVYSLQYLNKMSPSVLDGFRAMDLPVVVRISDFGLICPQAHFLNGSTVCTKCIDGNFLYAPILSCVQGSRVKSFVKAMATILHRILRCNDRISAFIFPSMFTKSLFARAGFPEEKLHVLPTFIDTTNIISTESERSIYLYFGRLVKEKGIHNLLRSYESIRRDKPKLVIIGDVSGSEYSRKLVSQYGGVAEFHEFMDMRHLSQYINSAICVIVPSVWYDNLPNVVLEAYAHGTPVIAPRHGSFVDLISDRKTGILYDAFDKDALKDSIEWAINNTPAMKTMGENAKRVVNAQHTPEKHYSNLVSILRLYK